MTVSDEVLALPVFELSRRLETGALRSVDLTAGYITRIERVAPALNCFITVTAERARDEAARADAARASGKTGPLLGMPFAVKDAIDTAAIPTTWGTRGLLDRIPQRDAVAVEKLREAGAVLLGKTSLTELCAAFNDDAPDENHGGACRNPWDRTRWSGGSSGGSAVAVASGLCAFALGTETLGSIDQPASWCGVVGLRPTYDLVSREGVMPMSWTLDKVGFLCRDARDVAVVLPVLAGTGALAAADVPLRIGIVDEMAEPVFDPANSTLWAEAKAELARAGMTLEPVVLPDVPRKAASETIIVTDLLVALDDFIRSGKASQMYMKRPWPEVEAELHGLGITGVDYVKSMQVRTVIQHAYRALFERFDAIATFGTPQLPQVIGTAPTRPTKPYGRQLVLNDGNLAGLPAITIPIGFTAAGLPRSMHVIAAPYEEHKLVTVAARYQARTAHHQKRPVV